MKNKKRIMIVEDEGITAMHLQTSLEDWGYTVTSVEIAGESAVVKSHEDRPDMVLMDISLAGKMDGIEAARKIYTMKNIPVIFITAHSDDTLVQRSKISEPFGFLIKPFNKRELAVAIEHAFYKHGMEMKLRASEEKFRQLAENIREVFWLFDWKKQKVIYVSPAYETVWGRPAQSLYERYEEWRESIFPDDLVSSEESFKKIIESGGGEEREYRIIRPDGSIRWISDRGFAIFNKEGSVERIAGIAEDITERKEMVKQLEDAAFTDVSTGLLNRRGFLTLTKQQCKIADRNRRIISILYLDLDGLKKINDELGHEQGDGALKDIADILVKSLRQADIIARLGGDEFAVLLSDTEGPDAEKTAIGHIRTNIKTHNETAGRRYKLSLSIGSSRYNPERPCSIDNLLHVADKSMYKDKQMNKLSQNAPHHNEKIIRRRKYARFRNPDNCFAELDPSSRVTIKNISTGGACIATPFPLSLDTVYNINIVLEKEEKICVEGIAVWVSSADSSVKKSESTLYESGLKFIKLTDNVHKSLDNFIDHFCS